MGKLYRARLEATGFADSRVEPLPAAKVKFPVEPLQNDAAGAWD